MIDIDCWQSEIGSIKKNKNNRVIKKNSIDLINKIVEKKDNKNNNDFIDTREILNNNDGSNSKIKITKNKSLGIDSNTMKKLKTGRYKIDKTVDFHGKTFNEALDLLIKEINDSYFKGLRCLLVITGKGLRSQDKNKTIKGEIEKWLNHYLIADKIITYTDAIQKDGGFGAVYVLLKKNRKNVDSVL